VSARDVDNYLAKLDEPKRSTLGAVRRSILAVIPEAEEGLSYGTPAFKVQGKTVAGFAAFKNHLSYLPHSGSVLAELADDLTAYERTKGALHFRVDEPLPVSLIRRLIRTRMQELPRS
jgi:uncharacterized protein YdhG (YjbR/CyaY superfamily)